MKKSLIGLSLLALGLTGAAYAAETMPGDPLGNKTTTKAEFVAKGAEMFAKMDVNQDGKLDAADRSAREGARFDQQDVNHDGALSRAEFMAGHQRGPEAGGPEGRRGDHKGGRGKGGHGKGGYGGGMMMKMADTNTDGAVTRDEFLGAQTKHFDMIDANHDGQLTQAERKAAHDKMRAMGGIHRGGQRGEHQMGAMPPPPPAN